MIKPAACNKGGMLGEIEEQAEAARQREDFRGRRSNPA
jgi:hypothetical protein